MTADDLRRCAEILNEDNMPLDDVEAGCYFVKMAGGHTLRRFDQTDEAAQKRVFRKLKELGHLELLMSAILESWMKLSQAEWKEWKYPLVWFACLTASEQWEILCCVIDKLDEVKNA